MRLGAARSPDASSRIRSACSMRASPSTNCTECLPERRLRTERSLHARRESADVDELLLECLGEPRHVEKRRACARALQPLAHFAQARAVACKLVGELFVRSQVGSDEIG